MTKTVLITGANKGLGLELVNLLSLRDPATTIFLGTRSIQNGKEALAKLKARGNPCTKVKVLRCDVTDSGSIADAVSLIKKDYGGCLHTIYNNAGVAQVSDHQSVRDLFAVNYTGVQSVVRALTPLIPRGGHNVIVTSEVGAWAHHGTPEALAKVLDHPENLSVSDVDAVAERYIESQGGGDHAKTLQNEFPDPAKSYGAYGVSKMLVSTYGRVIARELKEKGIITALVCPGYCATDINGNHGFRQASMGAKSIAHGATIGMDETGGFFQDGKKLPMRMPNADMAEYKKQAEAFEQELLAKKHA